MKITDIKVFPVREEKLKAFVSIILDDCFMVNDIKVIKGQDGFFISMPSRRKRNGKFKDIAHPLNNETRQSMEQEILAAYQEHLVNSPEDAVVIEPRPSAEAVPNRRRRRSRGRRRRGSGEPARDSAASPSEGRPGESEGRPEAGPDTASQPRAETRPQDVRSERRAEPAAEPAAERAGLATGEGRDRREPAEPPARDDTDVSDKSAEEVAEHHLSDSFWET